MGNKLAEAVGPFHDTSGVATVLGVTEQVVEERRAAGTILAVQTSDGVWVYPVFQFGGHEVDPELLPAIHALRDRPAWSAALWLVTPNDDLDGLSPIAWIRAGRPTVGVTLLAQRTSGAWA